MTISAGKLSFGFAWLPLLDTPEQAYTTAIIFPYQFNTVIFFLADLILTHLNAKNLYRLQYLDFFRSFSMLTTS